MITIITEMIIIEIIITIIKLLAIIITKRVDKPPKRAK